MTSSIADLLNLKMPPTWKSTYSCTTGQTLRREIRCATLGSFVGGVPFAWLLLLPSNDKTACRSSLPSLALCLLPRSFSVTVNITMKVSVASCLLFATSAVAFAPQRPAFSSSPRPLYMSDEDAPASAPAGALVPIKEETVEFTAGLLGGAAGLFLGGPVLGIIGAAAANYVSKMGGDVGSIVQEVSKSSINIFNYLASLDQKYEVLGKAKNALEKSLSNLKSQDQVDPAAIDKVEKALKSTNAKIKEINDEYDLVGGGMTALGVIGDLVEKAVTKAGELNEEYQLSDKAKKALSSAVDKAKTAAKEAAP